MQKPTTPRPMYQDLKGAIKAECLTISQIARKRGISASYLNNALNGRSSLRIDIAYEIMSDLNLPLERMSESEAKAYLERMVNGGYITADEAAYAYQVELGRTSGTSSVPKTYQEYVSATGNAGILSSSEFTARKKAGASGLSQYSSYQDYLAQKYTATKK